MKLLNENQEDNKFLLGMILRCIDLVKEIPKSRIHSIVNTKLEEAALWMNLSVNEVDSITELYDGKDH